MKTATLPLLVLALAGSAQASVECKVGDKWYPYSSAECQGKSTEFRQAPRPGASSARPAKPEPVASVDGWEKVRPQAVAMCEKRHDSHSLQAGCLRNEERGYRDMQGTYDLPADVAAKAKARCALRHESWALRSGCMRNESKGYKSLRK